MAPPWNLVIGVAFLFSTAPFLEVTARSFSPEHRTKRQTSSCTCSNWSQWIRCLPDPTTTTSPVPTRPTPTPGICYSPQIGAVAADVVFLLDESGSVGATNFQKELNFVECFVNRTVIGPTMVQMGLLTFSWYASNKFFLGDNRDAASLRSTLRNIDYVGGSSYTDKGLKYARLESFRRVHGMREQAQPVLVVVVDGKSENASATIDEANELRRLGIDVFAVGVGNGVDRAELATIATDSSRLYIVSNFDQLSTVCSSLVRDISKIDGKWTVWGSWSTCSKTCGLGSRIRKRTCTDPCPANGGASCKGDDTINQACTMGECGEKQIDGNWANWGFWSPCTATCGCGTQFRERTCSNPSPYNGGQTCFGSEKETQNCGCASCPADGAWSEWSGWGSCSKTCGGGTQSRARTCSNPFPINGGLECIGDSKDVRECFPNPCPVHGAYTAWGLWSACGQTCGGGERHRERFCSNPAPQNGGTNCLGANTDTETCNTQTCPRNGVWGGWSNWGQCSVTCANGIHIRRRLCNSPSPAFGGQYCPGESNQTQICMEKECPIDGNWAEWGCWSLCSKTCGTGERSRMRNCSNPCPTFGGKDCVGNSIETESCNTNPCVTVPGITTTTTTTPPPPVHGGWSVWGSWSNCAATCGNGGLRIKTRTCNNPTPDRGGRYCEGNEYETGACVLPPCPINGGFSEWSAWSPCSLSCGNGTQFRTRSCDNPTPSNNGAVCSGPTSEVVNCNAQQCPVDGRWSAWTLWGTCSESCGGGLQQRTRTCTNPFPINGGKQCDGTGFESQACSLNSCPVNGNWGGWSDWNTCGVTCGGATQVRQRSCDNPQPSGGGSSCSGSFQDSQQCATQPCPRNGNWAQWNLWSVCSVTCNSGLRRRQRECTSPAPLSGGQYCKGSSTVTELCNTFPCPTNGQWGEWGPWGACSRTCNTGSQLRIRRCNNPAPVSGGLSCVGSATETSNCQTQSCPLDGNWAFWSEWSTCTVSCGGGIHTRNRTCTNPAPKNNGKHCSGADVETQSCNTALCIIDGNWGEWGGYSACSLTCGQGSQTRSRECNNPFPLNGGRNCFGNSLGLQSCFNTECPIHGGWSTWQSWSVCTKRCGKGVTTRLRECASPSPQFGGKYCEGDYFQTDSCADIPCPVNGGLGSWSQWTTCTRSCGGGDRTRTRSCDSPSPSVDGLPCTGNTLETQECNLNLCPINGNWNQWQYWSPCSRNCGAGSTRYRERTCTDPSPLNGGSTCVGSPTETEACAVIPCPVDGGWGQWSVWSNCPTTCGPGGWRESTRQCDSPAQANGGNFCEGDSKKYSSCPQSVCPVDGRPGEWGPWTSCSVTCGVGSRSRLRYCNNPSPQGTGASCDQSALFISETCTLDVCTTTTSTTTTTPAPTIPPVNGNWGQWNSWFACSASCGGGSQERIRHCDSPPPNSNGVDCVGDRTETRPCNTFICEVDGNWGQWGSYSTCSSTCGTGRQTRIRLCDSPQNSIGGRPCSGAAQETIDCNTQNCPINGNWAAWSGWGSCSKPCDRGFWTRVRSCTNPPPLFGGQYCVGDPEEYQSCNTQNCPIDGGLGLWGAWDTCSASCGTGSQRRTRKCNNPAPAFGGRNCSLSSLSETVACNTDPCPTTTTTTTTTPPPTIPPVDGNWGSWTGWGRCTKTCNTGQQSRSRLCNNPAPNNQGKYCVGDNNVETQTCNTQACPIDGHWGEWSSFTVCSRTCGGGTRTRTRRCNRPEPEFGGLFCSGSNTETIVCSPNDCPIHGNWSPWGSWDACSQTCGGGYQTARRTCTSPPPSNGGRYCNSTEHTEQKKQDCNTLNCPVDGGISTWGAWMPCPISCGSGTQQRFRYCNNPAPANGGDDCSEFRTMDQPCVLDPCPTTTTTTTTTPAPTVPTVDGSWFGWSAWTNCGRACGGALRSRHRSCSPPSGNGKICEGSNYEEESCGDSPCPIDGNWGSWGAFSTCPVPCGGGTYSRKRFCINPSPSNGGLNCAGLGEDTRDCNTNPCPVNGGWSNWVDWSTCTKTCGSGTQFRYRICDSPSPMYSGLNCIGDVKETRSCANTACPINGGWSSWGAYGSCSVSCGRGQYTRERFCNNPSPLFNGAVCRGSTSETTICVMPSCPVDGSWGQWSAWSLCSRTCGGGEQFQQRYCNDPPSAHGGSTCAGDKTKFQSCSTNSCPVHGAWGNWNAWSSCSVSCGGGSQKRRRVCDSPAPDFLGNACPGADLETQSCGLQGCPVDGAWSGWISSECSVRCGGGTRRRVRTCTNPAPINNGLACAGNEEDTETCNTQNCPVNGGFSNWGRWSGCNRSCGRGIQTRQRLCDNPTPSFGGYSCVGNVEEAQECTNAPCSVNGGFSQWFAWTACSRTCGTGTRFRYRTCTSPRPEGSGTVCIGEYWEQQQCSTQACPTVPPPTTTPGVYITVECSQYNADIVFLLENNCDADIFNQELNFVRTAVKLFNLRTDATQISVVSYTALQPTEHFDLKTYYNTTQMLDAIDRIPNQCGVRDTDAALRYARTSSLTPQKGSRSNSVKVVVLVTSGRSTNPTQTSREAALLRDQNVKTIVVGFGSYSLSELQSVAYNNDHVFTVTNANLLYTIRDETLNSLCSVDGQWGAWGNYGPCSTSCGDGFRYRIRKCDNPPRAGSGKDCENENFEVGYCTEGDCPTTTTTTTTPATTTTLATVPPETCEYGTYFRRRNCNNPFPGAADCIGKEVCYYSSPTQCISVPPTTPAPVVIDPPELDNIPGCGSVPADIVFLLDKSTSVGKIKFRKLLRFVSRFVQSVSIGPDGVHISIVTYNNYAHNEFSLNAHSDKASLLQAIDAIQYDSGLTYTNLGLKYVRTESFKDSVMRDNVAHIAIVLTEGASYQKEETMRESAELRQANIKTIVIGIGAECDRSELEYMGDVMFEVPNVEALVELEYSFQQTVCEVSNVWTLVMSVSRGQSVYPASGVYDLWNGPYTMNENDEKAKTLRLGSKPFKSSMVEMWNKFNFTAVRVSFFTNGMEKAYITFDGKDTTKRDWFNCRKIISTPFAKLKDEGGDRYCGIMGDDSLKRRFFIHGAYTGCSSDSGWMAVVEGNTCSWEQRTDKPYFVYSSLNDKQTSAEYDIADVFAVFVDIDYCSSQPCKNGGECEELPGNGYHCKCPVNFFGMNCEHQCEAGTYGVMCRETCSKGCVDNKCIRLTGVCLDGCKPGYIGEQCDQECAVGKYGDGCTTDCSSGCLGGKCDAQNGKCQLGCIIGFTGDLCDAECTKGTYGLNCKESCSSGCKDTDCHSVNGKCLSGCNVGLKGDYCDEECAKGTYGDSCTESCNVGCKDNDCEPKTGKCKEGCIVGKTGEKCDADCAKGTYGEDCKEVCSAGCNGNDCDPKTGNCKLGCKAEYTGDKCDTQTGTKTTVLSSTQPDSTTKPNPGSTDRNIGGESEEQTSKDLTNQEIIIIAVVSVSVLLLIVVLIYLFMRRNKKPNSNISTSTPNSSLKGHDNPTYNETSDSSSVTNKPFKEVEELNL